MYFIVPLCFISIVLSWWFTEIHFSSFRIRSNVYISISSFLLYFCLFSVEQGLIQECYQEQLPSNGTIHFHLGNKLLNKNSSRFNNPRSPLFGFITYAKKINTSSILLTQYDSIPLSLQSARHFHDRIPTSIFTNTRTNKIQAPPAARANKNFFPEQFSLLPSASCSRRFNKSPITAAVRVNCERRSLKRKRRKKRKKERKKGKEKETEKKKETRA